jgi:hypothetical protein
MRRCVLALSGALLVLFAFAPLVYAQRTTGEIIGVVTDEQSAVLPGVTITIRGPGVSGSPSIVTSENGS